jgi:hypothetical protein
MMKEGEMSVILSFSLFVVSFFPLSNENGKKGGKKRMAYLYQFSL